MSVQGEMMSSNAYWLWWNESNKHVSLSHGMLLSVVVDKELVHLDGRWNCRSMSLCAEWWSHWTWRLVRSCQCCPSCRVVVLCQWVATGSVVQSPFFPFNVVSFLFNANSAAVCPHAVTLLGSNVKNQPPYLSLIHIWRCRRSTLCRSRWSPYH